MIFREKATIFVIEDFFPNFDPVAHDMKNIPKWKWREHPEDGKAGQWPGYRSRNLAVDGHPIVPHYMELATPYLGGEVEGSVFAHTRLADDEVKERVHCDMWDISGLVYLSETNLESSTRFYDSPDKDANVVAEVKFVQNRAVFFSAPIPHRSFGNHGETLETGRLTLNLFSKYVGNDNNLPPHLKNSKERFDFSMQNARTNGEI